MQAISTKFKTVDEYLSAVPAPTRRILQQVRQTIKKAAPQAEEVISYNMPAFKLHGVLVYYAAYQKHIGFYPTPSAIKSFQKELSQYESSKGAVQFPIDEPMPVELITKIVQFRVRENLAKGKAGKQTK
jgi:uncharacterized protein YdhG (YjbR/CyaY superfamily)